MTSTTATLDKPVIIEDTGNAPVDIYSITLGISDRCDACGPTSQAFVIAGKDDKVLFFCGHHGRKFEASLIAQGFDVVDHRDKINERASASSA